MNSWEIPLNIGLNLVYNLIRKENLWSLYVLFAWTIAFSVHSASYLIYSKGVIGLQKIALILHAVIFVLSCPTLFVINYISGFTYLWFLWPDLSWIVAIIVHFALYKFFLRHKDKPEGNKSWIDRKIDDEIKKVKKRVA